MIDRRCCQVFGGGLIAALTILWTLVGGVAVAGGPLKAEVVFRRGVTAGKPWVVAATSESVEHRPQGICLYTAIVYPEGGYLCARPRKRRGMVTVNPFGRAPHGKARMTLIAGAFNPAVRTLRLTLDGGDVVKLHPHRIHSNRAVPRIKAYRYVAKAMRGSVCAKRLETIGPSGEIFWDASEYELESLRWGCTPGA